MVQRLRKTSSSEYNEKDLIWFSLKVFFKSVVSLTYLSPKLQFYSFENILMSNLNPSL